MRKLRIFITWIVLFFLLGFVISLFGGIGIWELLLMVLVATALTALYERGRPKTTDPRAETPTES